MRTFGIWMPGGARFPHLWQLARQEGACGRVFARAQDHVSPDRRVLFVSALFPTVCAIQQICYLEEIICQFVASRHAGPSGKSWIERGALMMFRHFAVPLSFCVCLLGGCALSPTAGPVLDPASSGVRGVVHGGQQPVFGATVSIYEVGSTSYGVASTTPKATTTSSLVDGSFSFVANAYTCTASNTPMYLVATAGHPEGTARTRTLR